MNEKKVVLASDGLPLKSGDVVTRRSEEVERHFYAHNLKRGVVLATDFEGADVLFEESFSGEYVGGALYCFARDLIHLETTMNLPAFNVDQFRALLGM